MTLGLGFWLIGSSLGFVQNIRTGHDRTYNTVNPPEVVV
jgi:hypothetical protein